MNAPLRPEPLPYIVDRLSANPKLIDYDEAGAPIVALDRPMMEDLARIGWPYLGQVEASVEAVNTAFEQTGVTVKWKAPPVTGISEAYAELEGTMITFEATLMAASERYAIPHLVLVGTGTEERVMLARDWTERANGPIIRERKEDMQEVIFEDPSERERPRKINARLYGKALVDRFARGQRLRVTGVYRLRAGEKRKDQDDTYSYWVEVLRAEALDGTKHHTWTRKGVDAMKARRRELGSRKFVSLLADSIAPNVPGQAAIKTSYLLSAVGGSVIGNSPRNIHTLACGDPGTGKSEILEYITPLIGNATFGAGEAMSARGMTYGMAEWDGRKMLAAGVMVLKRCVCIDEFQAVPRETLDGIKLVMSSQKATYNKTGYSVETPTDCTVIAAMNPAGKNGWDPVLSAIENLEPVPSAILTRMNVFRVSLQVDYIGRSEAIMAHALGDEEARPDVGPEEMRQWIEWCASRPDPAITREAATTIRDFFIKYGKALQQRANTLVQARQEMSAYRNACGFARLCGDAKAGPEHAEMALNLLSVSLESLGMSVQTPEEEAKAGQVHDKELVFIECVSRCDREYRDRGGFMEADLIEWMSSQYPQLWADAYAAHAYAAKGGRLAKLTHNPDGGDRMRAN